MSLFKRFFVGAGYSLFGSIANRGLMAAATIFYARFLGAHFYGIYINVLAIINLFVIFSLFGLSNSYTTLLSHIPSKEKRIASVYAGLLLVISLLLIITIVMVAGYQFIAQNIYGGKIEGVYILLAIFPLAAYALNLILLAILQGLQEFKYYSFALLSQAIYIIMFSILGIIFFQVKGLVVGNAIGYFISNMLMFQIIVKRMKYDNTITSVMVWTGLKEIVHFSFPVFLSGLFVAPTYWIGNIILVKYGGVVQSGYFGVANALAQLVLFVPVAIAAPLIPLMSEISISGNVEKFSNFVTKNIRVVWCIAMPLTLFFGTSAVLIINLFFGREYSSSANTFALLSCTNLFVAIDGIAIYALLSINKVWQVFLANLIWFISILLFGWFFIREYGHTGFAGSLFGAYIIFGIVIFFFLNKNITIQIISHTKKIVFAITLVCFSGIWWMTLHHYSQILQLLIASCSSIGLLLIEWKFVLNSAERDTIAGYMKQNFNLMAIRSQILK